MGAGQYWPANKWVAAWLTSQQEYLISLVSHGMLFAARGAGPTHGCHNPGWSTVTVTNAVLDMTWQNHTPSITEYETRFDQRRGWCWYTWVRLKIAGIHHSFPGTKHNYSQVISSIHHMICGPHSELFWDHMIALNLRFPQFSEAQDEPNRTVLNSIFCLIQYWLIIGVLVLVIRNHY